MKPFLAKHDDLVHDLAYGKLALLMMSRGAFFGSLVNDL
jgi:hypothetical protein